MHVEIFVEGGVECKGAHLQTEVAPFHLDFSKAIFIKYFRVVLLCNLFLFTKIYLFDKSKECK